MRLKVGLTGSTGVLGRHIRACDQFDFSCFAGEITRREDVFAWMQTLPRLDAMLHLAAVVPVAQVNDDPERAAEVNVEGTRHLLEAMHSAAQNSTWFFYASTAHVYEPSHRPISVTHSVKPITIYGETKFRGEQVVMELASEYAMPYCIGRIFSYTSPWQSRDFLIPNLCERIRSAATNARLPLRGGKTARDFSTADQIAGAIVALAMKRHAGIVNIGSGRKTYVRDIAIELRTRLGRDDVLFDFDDAEESSLVADVATLPTAATGGSLDAAGLVTYYLEGCERHGR